MKKPTQNLSGISHLKFTGKLLLIALFFITSCQSIKQFVKTLNEFHNPESEYVMVAAHRAAHNIHPENSIPAIQRAIDLGVDIIESQKNRGYRLKPIGV